MTQSQKNQLSVSAALPDHMAAIWRFALSLSGNKDTADDLTQSTCLRALEKAHQFDGSGSLIGWCLTICRSIWLNELRAKSKRQMGDLQSVNPIELIDHTKDTETNIFAREVFTQVMQLPEAQRSVVELVYVQGFKYSEAAKILDIPMGTVMSRLFVARKALAHLRDDLMPTQKGQGE